MGQARVTACTVMLLCAVGLLDSLSSAEIAASLGYLLPISCAAWGYGRLGATLVAAVCAGMWLGIEVMTSSDGAMPELTAVNMIVLTVAFQLFGQLLGTLRDQLNQERKLARTDPLTSLHNRRAFWRAAATAHRFRWPTSTSMVSKASTMSLAITPAMNCCGASRSLCARICVNWTWWRDSAAMSS